MSTPPIVEQVRWQDLRVKSEIDIVFEIAKKENWEDCEVFGSGDMITQPQESMGWKLIPADLYRDSIPLEAVGRLHQIINAGVRVRGVIIADDERRQEPAPAPARLEPPPAPARPRVSLSAVWNVLMSAGRAAGSFIEAILSSMGTLLSFAGRALFGLLRVAGVIALVALAGYALIHFWSFALLGLVIFGFASAGTSTGTRMDYDPKLVILVDDGKGGTAWVSLFTWYD